MSSVPKKKSKTSQEAELDALRQYLLDCPVVPKNSRCLQIALNALDQERKRMDRDAKLQRKFANTASTTSNSSTSETQQSASSYNLKNTKSTTNSEPLEQQQQHQQQEDDAELMEWQDVSPSQEQIVETPLVEGSVLGKTLAQSAISKMANSQTSVASPLGAVALAIHAALVGETLGFKCTGIPNDEEQQGSSKGFAAPIRELPKNQLVPNEWDKNSLLAVNPTIKLRYRKDGVGSTVLQVSLQQDDDVVRVELIPSSTMEPHHVLTFPLKDHVNLDSLSKALAKDGRVVPTLHYKALPVLLTNVCNTFDLGPVEEDNGGGADDTSTSVSSSLPYVDTTIVNPTIYRTGIQPSDRRPYDQHVTPNIRDFQPELRRPGDFDRDLYPSGIVDDSVPSGNLMGPHHPAFGGEPGAVGSGYGMRPRFDPFGPPGGPQDPRNQDPNRQLDPNNPQRRGGRQGPRPQPPGGTGDPNPDHARPPNNLNNSHMYM